MIYSRRRTVFFLFAISFVVAIRIFIAGEVLACSRVLSADNGQAVLAGRNMDWPVDLANELWVFPRGMERSGLVENPITWTSKYGSLAVASFSTISNFFLLNALPSMHGRILDYSYSYNTKTFRDENSKIIFAFYLMAETPRFF